MKAGVLALQGDFREHALALREAGAAPIEVRTPEDLAEVQCLVIPGGESTTIAKLARAYGLVDPIRERAAAGMPMFGTCAGMIVLARRVDGGAPLFGLMDIGVRRNAYGRQVDSFEADLDVEEVGPVRGVFIRAPVVEDAGRAEVLASHEGRPVAVRQGHVMALAFHPELSGDLRLHREFLKLAAGVAAS